MVAPVVVALGGSLLHPDEDERHIWLQEICSIVANHVQSGDHIYTIALHIHFGRAPFLRQSQLLHSWYHETAGTF